MKQCSEKTEVCVVGAGIIGITSALELLRRGVEVLLVDRSAPATQTTFGNAGVLSASTVLNVNNPGMLTDLPKLVFGQSSYFSYDFWYAVSRLPWLAQFLRFAGSAYSVKLARALQDLQRLSIERHRDLVAGIDAGGIFRELGWIKAYRDTGGLRKSTLECSLMDDLGVSFRRLSADDLAELEPGLNPVYRAGLFMSQTCSVTSPYELAMAYLNAYNSAGGRYRQFDVRFLGEGNAEGWVLSDAAENRIEAGQIVIAGGPWADDLCHMAGYKIPLAWERGYHWNVASPPIPLRRPVCDVQHGFVMAPQGTVTRISSGVEFAHRDARPNHTQIERAVASARMTAAFGEPVDQTPWLGSRPTLPDGLPMIGAAPRHANLWFNFGHQHIGLGTSAGSAAVLADLVCGQATAIDEAAFRPDRFRI